MKSLILSVLAFGLLPSRPPSLKAQPVPHHFDGITVAPDKSVALSLNGGVSNMFNLTSANSNQFTQMFDLYVVDASTNLRDWTRLALLPRTNSNVDPLLVQDTNAADFTHRFYRTFTNHLITAFPKPTGPFAVGTLVRILTDSSRSNRYGIRTNSSFMSTFWYPAEPSNAAGLPGSYTDKAVAGDRSLYSYWGWSLQWTNVMSHCVAHSFSGVPLAPGTNRFPIILHSHGWTCDRTFNSQNAAELASHGYIVAAVDHEDCHATVYPDERGTCYVSPGSRQDAALGPSRTKDLGCLLRELSQMDTSDPVLAGRLDLDRIGIMGFSLGGGIAAETARLDSRVKCAALLDAWMPSEYFPELGRQGLRKPFLAMNHTINDHGFDDFAPYSQPLFDLATTNVTWLKIVKSGHFTFSDFAWAVEMTSSSRQGAVAINACLLWFFDRFLRDEAGPFPSLPEIIDLKTK